MRRLNDSATYTLLAETLRNQQYKDGDYATPSEIIEVLGALGGPGAASVILDWVRASDPTAPSWPESQVIWALTAIGADATEPLAAILNAPLPAKDAAGSATDVERHRDRDLIQEFHAREDHSVPPVRALLRS